MGQPGTFRNELRQMDSHKVSQIERMHFDLVQTRQERMAPLEGLEVAVGTPDDGVKGDTIRCYVSGHYRHGVAFTFSISRSTARHRHPKSMKTLTYLFDFGIRNWDGGGCPTQVLKHFIPWFGSFPLHFRMAKSSEYVSVFMLFASVVSAVLQ